MRYFDWNFSTTSLYRQLNCEIPRENESISININVNKYIHILV
jgi:hypothetical protein